MEKVLDKVVSMVKLHSEGIPLKKLAVVYSQTYHENLTLSLLGFSSVESLVSSLHQDLVLDGELVLHKDKWRKRQAKAKAKAKAGAGASCTQDDEITKKILEDVVSMMKDHPAGVPQKKVAIVYNQTYRQNLSLASLGFSSMSSLLEALSDDLVLMGDMVFHKTHQPHSRPSRPSADSRPQTPLGPDHLMPSPDVRAQTSVMGLSFLGPSLLSTSPLLSSQNPPGTPPLTVSKPAETLSQQMLYDRVIQVMRTYQLVVPSMDQLEKFYLQMFGEPLPRAQYISLYDHWEASCPKAPPSQPTPDLQSKHVQDTPAAAAAQPPVWQADPQPSTSSLLASADFPALSRDVSRERSSKVKDMPLKDSAAPVFKDGYHAQLREMLGGNMRAYEALEEDEEEVTGRRRRKALDQDSVNSLMEEVIREIAAEGEHVTREKVISRVCQLLQIPSSDVGRMTPWKFPALKDLQYIMKEINMFIECTEAVTSISTLYELGQSLAGLKDKKHFEELNLGPLCKLPLVHRMFKIDGNTKDDDVRQIRTVDILRQLRTFRRQVNKPKVDLAEFLKFLADHYSCDSPYELGIRIHSIGLPISTLMKVSRAEHLILEQARELIQRELEEEAQERLRKMKRNVLDPLQGASSSSSGNFELRKKYVSMTASEVVLAVFSNAEGVFSPKMAKHVQSFLLQVSGNPLMRALFQLSICGGSLAVPQDLVLKDKTTKNPDQPKPEDSAPTSLPSEGRVKQFVRDSLSSHSSAITLAHVANLEKKLTRHFQVKDFLCLRQGNFLEFLVKHVQLLQDCLGSSLILSSSSMDPSGSSFRPSRQDVFEFINQCGEISSTDPEQLSHIESALRTHFRVRDSRDLGFGALHSLADLVQRQRSLSGGGLSPVHYEAALFARHNKTSIDVGGGAVGRLGEVSKDQALSCLLRCPLLEDLSEWSQWELVFKPRHGPLKDFIERNAGNSGLSALEVSPGQLLRITSHTGDRHFSAAVTVLDPAGAAGHLVSMVITDGIANTPTALLANHVQSSLAAAIAQEEMSRDEEDVSSYSRVAKFLLECFIRIPTRISQALLNKVFLEPFSSVLGQTKSKRVLIAVAQSDPRHLNCLHRLGILLGVTEWIRDFQKKLDPPEDHRDTQAATEDHTKSNLLNSESSSLSGLNTSEDEFTEENIMDGLDQTVQPVNGEHEQGEDDDGEEEEELYELTVLPNGETSAVSSEAEDTQDRADSDPSSDYEKSSDSQSETEVDVHRAIIEDIRKSEFGIGVELNAEGQKLMKVHQERLGRSLDRLSTELYSKDTHFVLELIQNADDNSYPSGDGVVPALAFVVERDCITILNNETGFQEKNIRAICDVGRSTKGKHKYGYIGQKGIGFKSVFKVTDCPEIHSNGFHLRFDKSCGPMGYILPHWAEDERTLNAPLKEQNLHSWTTKICLPLRSENHQTRNLFHDVHPSLLLFLHRLRSIVIYNQSEKRLVRMTRKDLSHSVLEVEHSEGLERWLVVKTMVQPKKIKENVESTELALAFQLDTNSTGSDIIIQLQKQPVFAYLPLRSFGFRFIIQGDFDIPSSREDVDRDSSWNQWLRSEIPQLFLKAMDVFTAHPEFSGLKGLCQFLQFVPLPDEVLDFFKPVAGQIIQLLKGKAFLPTLSPDGQLVYKLPSQIAVCQDAVIRDVIGGEELERHLSLSYLHPDLSRAAPTSLLAHLGVRNLRGSDVTTVTTAMAKELLQVEGIHSESGLRQLARLLVCNFRALEHGYGEAESILQTLRELPIIPLADGRMVSLNGEGVFFPMEETKTKKKKKAQSSSAPLSALYEDVSVVHPSLLSCVDPLQSQQIAELLRRLGVHDLEPQQLLQQHIYPTIQSNKWKSKPSAVVVSYLVFIKQHSSSQEYADAALPVLTNRGLLCPANERVHFSEEYGNINLTKTLPGCDWLLLSPCYVQTDGDVEGWRELFTRLGVRDGLIIRKQRQTLTAKDLACSVWSAESSGWFRSSADECVIEDFPCEEFQALASAQLSDDLLQQQRTNLLQLLNDNWDTGHRYSQYLTAQVVDQDGRPIRNTRSSFHHMLCSLPWVPAYQPQEGELRERRYLRPNSVYLTSDQIYSLLGTHVCYVDLQPGEFSRALGMNHTVSVDALIKYLKDWCEGPEEQGEDQRADGESEGRSFSSTVQHIHNMYTYLHNNCPQSRLKELFQHTPAVFIEYKRGSDGWCSGRFSHLKEVCWSDPTSMFQRYRQLTQRPDSPVQQPKVLAPFYGPLEGMKAFFARALNVDLSPNMNQYVGLLELVCSSHPTPNTEILQDVSVLYARLALKCSMAVSGDQDHTAPPSLNPAYCSTLKGMVSDKRVFPTKENTWVSLSRRPMISDSKELEKVFKSHGEVCLLSLPPAEKKNARRTGQSASDRANSEPAFSESERSQFLQICGVRRLSDCVKSEPQTENLRPCPSMQAMVRSVVPYIQKFLFHHDELAEVYQELVESNISQKIKKLQFSQVGKLYIRYQLNIAENQDLVELQDVICLLKDQKELYIQKDHLHARLEVCRELVKLFCTEDGHRKELRRFLSSLMTINDQDQRSLKGFLQQEDIRDLPADQELWEVPEPPAPEVHLERVLSRTKPSMEVTARPAQEDGEETLACWPPRASLQNTGSSRTASADGAGVVEAVMKMWPPPAGPKDRDPEREGPGSSQGNLPIRASHEGVPPIRSNTEGSQPIRSNTDGNQPIRSNADGNQPIRSSRPADQPGFQKVLPQSGGQTTTTTTAPQTDVGEQSESRGGEDVLTDLRPAQTPPDPATETSTNQTPPSLQPPAPEAVLLPSVFQGAAAAAERPPLNLDFPVWSSQVGLEDMELRCQRPDTVVLSEDSMDIAAIGEWGEQLVFSFLCHWRDSGDPESPAHILWCNQSGESGQPYDFRLTLSSGGVVYVEVKATIKKEKSFIHLSANELDFALKEKDRYHIFRVYSAGDAANVRLCRIKNLAQHLHSKELQLYLFL